MTPPFFIIGNPRSGTTLFRLMLTNHRNLVVPPECGFAVWLFPDFQDWGARTGDLPDLTAAYARRVVGARKFETWGLSEAEVHDALLERRPQTYAEAVDAVYRLFATSIGKRVDAWGDKNNFYLDHIPQIREIFPECRFLHVVRDGRDVACSYRALLDRAIASRYSPALPAEISAIATSWLENLTTIRNAFATYEWEGVLEIRYEDLVREPEDVLRRVCAFLDQPFDADMLAYPERNREEGQEPAEFLAWKQKTLEPPTDSEVGKYRREMTPSEVETFNRIAGEMLATYDYDLAPRVGSGRPE